MPSVALAIVTQRPRPSYIFPLSFGLILLFLAGVRMIICRFTFVNRSSARRAGRLAFAASVVAGCGFPFIERAPVSSLPILTDYRRLLPHRAQLSLESASFCSDVAWRSALANYLARGQEKRIPAIGLDRIIASSAAQESELPNVGAIYFSASALYREDVKRWLAGAEAAGWKKLAEAEADETSWALWTRQVSQ